MVFLIIAVIVCEIGSWVDYKFFNRHGNRREQEEITSFVDFGTAITEFDEICVVRGCENMLVFNDED